MDDPLVMEVLDRLDADETVGGEVEDLVLGALLGELDEVIGGARPERPERADAAEAVVPVRAYLESVTVTGFRGIGPTCRLDLHAGPGLTLVVGRNGSGKSSLAEAAEFALTGDSRRWAGKTAEWKRGWRNLHTSGESAIAVSLRTEGEKQPRTVRVRWGDSGLESSETAVTVPGRGRHTLESLGWDDAVRTFRPFLSYKELSTMVEGRPVDRYNELEPMLGMQSLRDPVESLRSARLEAQKSQRAAKERVAEVVGRLTEQSAGTSDERFTAAVEALRGDWDLDAVEGLVAGSDSVSGELEGLFTALEQVTAPDFEDVSAMAENLREAAARVGEFRGSSAERAGKLVGLLRTAVELHEQHGDTDCPVCENDNGLSSERVMEMRDEIERLQGEARAVEQAQRILRDARDTARNMVVSVPGIPAETETVAQVDVAQYRDAWDVWADPPDADTALADHLESACLPLLEAAEAVRTQASAARERLRLRWRPAAVDLAEMLPVARESLRAERWLKPLVQAERWIKACANSIRDERFESVKAQVKGIWDTLAVGSNVDLRDVRLGAKKVDMDVTVDGTDGSALGVMSQGELNCLALSLFIPRVGFDESPFGFAVLDDPVQAMDPVRVDGLAKVLHGLAETRQVVVFTHDNRLPETVRRLQMPATILSAARRPGSLVELRKTLSPVQVAVQDARAITLSIQLPEEVPRRVVPNLCRQAIEAACLESGRRRLLAAGLGFNECDQKWDDAARLLQRIAIALYGDADRAGDVYGTLRNKFGHPAVKTVRDCNQQTHSGAAPTADLKDLINRAEHLAEKLAAL